MLDKLFAAPGAREIAPVILIFFCRITQAPLSAVSMNSIVNPTNRCLRSAHTSLKGTSCVNKHWSGPASPQKHRNLTELWPRRDHNNGIDIKQCRRQALAVSNTDVAGNSASLVHCNRIEGFRHRTPLKQFAQNGEGRTFPDIVGSRAEGQAQDGHPIPPRSGQCFSKRATAFLGRSPLTSMTDCKRLIGRPAFCPWAMSALTSFGRQLPPNPQPGRKKDTMGGKPSVLWPPKY